MASFPFVDSDYGLDSGCGLKITYSVTNKWAFSVSRRPISGGSIAVISQSN
jgi:hypothetical protein